MKAVIFGEDGDAFFVAAMREGQTQVEIETKGLVFDAETLMPKGATRGFFSILKFCQYMTPIEVQTPELEQLALKLMGNLSDSEREFFLSSKPLRRPWSPGP